MVFSGWWNCGRCYVIGEVVVGETVIFLLGRRRMSMGMGMGTGIRGRVWSRRQILAILSLDRYICPIYSYTFFLI